MFWHRKPFGMGFWNSLLYINIYFDGWTLHHFELNHPLTTNSCTCFGLHLYQHDCNFQETDRRRRHSSCSYFVRTYAWVGVCCDSLSICITIQFPPFHTQLILYLLFIFSLQSYCCCSLRVVVHMIWFCLHPFHLSCYLLLATCYLLVHFFNSQCIFLYTFMGFPFNVVCIQLDDTLF